TSYQTSRDQVRELEFFGKVEIIKHENTEVMPQTSEMFESAFSLYKKRPDKEWQLTDCTSILIMEEFGLTEVLTGDDHFKQAGFSPLFRA
ncbi:MAG: type II toxin-antitoxin system VapC family toxin, partial [Nitrospinae bacterium]|nr:type II toxin-antitoxin system VapC family toxin [Nitrospinota bacterium]